MDLKGNIAIPTPRKQVWDFLTDPHQIGQCLRGVEKIEVIELIKKYRGTVSMELGSVKVRFNGAANVSSRLASLAALQNFIQ